MNCSTSLSANQNIGSIFPTKEIEPMTATAYAIALAAVLVVIIAIGKSSNDQDKKHCEPPSFKQCDVSAPGWPYCWCEKPF